MTSFILIFSSGLLIGIIVMSCFAAGNYKRGRDDVKHEIKKYLVRTQAMSEHISDESNFFKKRISHLIEILERGK